LRQHEEIAEGDTDNEKKGREEDEHQDETLGMRLHGRRRKLELPKHDRQREREAGHETDLHCREERLCDSERDRLATVGGKWRVQPVQEMPVKDEGNNETDCERAEETKMRVRSSSRCSTSVASSP
jgi:hypothetical protein